MILNGDATNDLGSRMDWMICIPQLYSKDEKSGFRGSCLSASFEMVSEYLFDMNKNTSSRSSTVGGWLKGGFFPNRVDKKNKYFWNQSTLHNFVWAEMSRLIDLACYPSRRWPKYFVSTFSAINEGEIPLDDEDRAWEYGDVKGQDEYLKIIKYTLELGLPLIVLVHGMKILKEESLFKYRNQNNEGCVYGTQPDRNYGNDVREEDTHGHAMVIYGMSESDDPDPLIRILDPSPSVDLRESPDSINGQKIIHRPDDLHYFYLKWSSLREFISNKNGLTIFNKSTLSKANQTSEVMRTIGLKSRNI